MGSDGKDKASQRGMARTEGLRHDDYRIAFFTNTYLPYIAGVPLSIEMYQRYLRQRGDMVRVYAPKYDGHTEDGGEIRRLPSIRQFYGTDYNLPLPIAFKPMMDFADEAFDIVHVHQPFLLGEMGLRMARQHGLPLALTYHTQYEQYTHYVPASQDEAKRTVIKHAAEFCSLCDLVIAPTHDIKKQLRGRDVKTPIEVLPTGIELHLFDEAGPDAGREALDVPPGKKLLLYVGRITEEKNLRYLVEACSKALGQREDTVMVLVGDGEVREELEQEVAGSQAAGRIRFVGKREGSELRGIYRAADLFVFASHSETQGMVIVEAMAGRTPVVALDADGIRGAVEDGGNGRLLPGDATADDFASAVVDALDNEERLADWAQQAYETAKAYDMPGLAERLHECYRKLKLLPNHRLNRGTMSFGLIRRYIDTMRQDMQDWFAQH